MPLLTEDIEEAIRMAVTYLEYANHYLELLQQQVDLLETMINNKERIREPDEQA